MKKLIVISMSILMAMFFTTTNARDTKRMALNTEKNSTRESKMERKEIRTEDRNLVSDRSIDAFMSDFGNIPNVIWEKDPYFDIASFAKDGIKYHAFYNGKSKLVGTTTQKTFANLPESAKKEINKQYEDYSVDKVIYYKDNEEDDNNILLYGTQFESADNYFVELSKNNKNIVLQVNPEGIVYFFKELQTAV